MKPHWLERRKTEKFVPTIANLNRFDWKGVVMSAVKSVLVVEDERSIADNIAIALKLDGLICSIKPTYQEGLRAAQEERHDLIILDIGLPDGNGFSLCKEIRSFSNVPLLFLTARNDQVDRIVGFELGADDYLSKPFSTKELVLRVKAILRRGQTESDNKPSGATPFMIDEPKHRISYYGETLVLSRYEFAILKLLLQRPGAVYTRDQIMNMIWDDPNMSVARTVDTHVKSIRQKLKAVRPDLQPIETHRGLGYSLKEKIESHSTSESE